MHIYIHIYTYINIKISIIKIIYNYSYLDGGQQILFWYCLIIAIAMASRSRRGASGAPRKRPARPLETKAETPSAETTPAPETAEEVAAREMEEIRKEVRHLPGI